jgi:Zn-finger nucleic acid-binding protein
MLCPACNEPAIALELDGVEIDRCPACAGIWLDEEEIVWLAQRSEGASRPLADALLRGPAGPGSKRRCPRCDRGMRQEILSSVELERCPAGHGIWFDAGEVETFLAACHQGDSAAAAAAIADILGRKPPPIPLID